jgi:hypothetical protein
MQDEVSRFVRDTLRIMGEVMAEHFGVETLARISGVDLPTEEEKQQLMASLQPPPPAPMMGMGMPAAPAPRSHPRSQRPRAAVMLQKPTWEQVGQLLQDDARATSGSTSRPIRPSARTRSSRRSSAWRCSRPWPTSCSKPSRPSRQNPQMGPLLGQMLMFTLRSFKAGRTLENVFEATMKKLEEAAGQPPNDPNKAKADADLAKTQAQGQTAIQVNNAKIAAEKRAGRTQGRSSTSRPRWPSSRRRQQQEAQTSRSSSTATRCAPPWKSACTRWKRHSRSVWPPCRPPATRSRPRCCQLQTLLQHMKGKTAVEVAEIGADTTLEAAQISAAEPGNRRRLMPMYMMHCDQCGHTHDIYRSIAKIE